MTKKRKIVITGSSKGIGKSIACKFAENNCDIFLISSNKHNLEKATFDIKNETMTNVKYCVANLKTEEGCNLVINEVKKQFGSFDTLIFCAGDTKSGEFLTQPIEDFYDGFALKFYSVVRLSKGLWNILKRKKGWLLTINGGMAHTPDPNFMVGGSVNAALQNFTKALSKKGILDGVNVNSINPGMTSTDRLISIIKGNAKREKISFAKAKKNALESLNLKRFSTPEEIAEVAFFICQTKVRHLNGTEINLDGGKKPTI
mgnify:FL=1